MGTRIAARARADMAGVPITAPKQGVLSRAVDAIVAAVAPEAGVRRRLARYVGEQIALEAQLGAFRGARSGRFRSGWAGATGSADSDTLDDLPTLRHRSRDLVYNNPLADGLLDTLVGNIAGQGLRPRARIAHDEIPGLSPERARELEQAMNAAWERWAFGKPDVTQRHDWPSIVQLLTRSSLEGGDSFVGYHALPRENRRAPYDFCLELLEADRVRTPDDKHQDDSIRGGVHVGALGQVRGYWVTKRHPGDELTTAVETVYRRRFDENGELRMDQLAWPARIHQNRGVPIFASTLPYFDHLDRYVTAEVVAARIAACIGLIVKKNNPYEAALGRATSTSDDGSERFEELTPGMVEYLGPGEEIQVVNPQRPGATFDAFVVRMIRLICRGLDLPYEIGSLDFTRSNYTASRAAQLEARRMWQAKQIAIMRFAQPIYERVQLEAYLRGEFGRVDFPRFRRQLTAARWLFPGWGWVDPKKEVEASQIAVAAGFSTRQREVAKWTGDDWEEVERQLIAEEIRSKELRQELGADDQHGGPDSDEGGQPDDDEPGQGE